MAVNNQTSKIVYVGNGSASNFTFPFKIFASTDLVVTKITIATGAQQLLALTTDYTVAGVGSEGGGSITLVAGALPSTHKVVIQRVVPYTQTVDYVANDPFPAETHEQALDRGVMISQQIKEAIDRTLKASVDQTSIGDLPSMTGNGGKAIAVKSDGTGFEFKPLTVTSVPYDASITFGTDASKAVSPSTGDLHLATDTQILYRCYASGTWTKEKLSTGTDAAKPASPSVGDVYLATDTQKMYRCYSAGVWSIDETVGALIATSLTADKLLLKDTTTPTTAADQIGFYAKVVSGVSEIHMRGESNATEQRVTKGGCQRLQQPNISCRVYHSAAQSISTGILTALALNSETTDTDGMHDTVTNNSRVTIQKPGRYRFEASVVWANAGTGYRSAYIRKNGSTYLGQDIRSTGTTTEHSQQVSAEAEFAVNDYVELVVEHSQGSSLDVQGVTDRSPVLTALMLSEA